MDTAWVRDATTAGYLFPEKVLFARIPSIGEIVWIEGAAHKVVFVSYDWSRAGPETFVDVSATDQGPMATQQ